MLVKRREDHVHHNFFTSPIGVSDWIARNYGTSGEIQVVSAFQNYGLLLRFVSSQPVEIIPSDVASDYREVKERESDSTQKHRIRGVYYLNADDTAEIEFEDPLLESMRGIRIYQEGGVEEYRNIMEGNPRASLSLTSRKGKGVTIRIDRSFRQVLHYQTVISIGTFEGRLEDGKIQIPPGCLRIKIEIELKGDFPDENYEAFAETPFELLKPELRNRLKELPTSQSISLENQLEALSILSRRGKLLAGGPRFFTYFGRDTLISLAILTGVIEPKVAIQGFESVLERLSPEGEVAHEETVGEFCIHSVQQETAHLQTVLEYHMVDDDFLLPAVLNRWNELEGSEEIQTLLEKTIMGPGREISDGFERLGKNIAYCYNRIREGLIPYHPSVPVGDWRDSLTCQGVHFSYEVNLGLASGFLQTVRQLAKDMPGLREHIPEEILSEKGKCVQNSFISDTGAFKRSMEIEKALQLVRNWIGMAGFNSEELEALEKRLAAIETKSASYDFFSMALDIGRKPIDIQHNDVAFALLFGNPDLGEIETMLVPLETPFPLGLKTDVGILVSNPVFSTEENIRRELNRGHYHGLVIWPLMHNLIYHGIIRQLRLLAATPEDSASDEKKADIIGRLKNLKDYLTSLPEKLGDYNTSELWSFSPGVDGDIPLAFGKSTGSSTESNPIQLWSSLGFTSLFI